MHKINISKEVNDIVGQKFAQKRCALINLFIEYYSDKGIYTDWEFIFKEEKISFTIVISERTYSYWADTHNNKMFAEILFELFCDKMWPNRLNGIYYAH